MDTEKIDSLILKLQDPTNDSSYYYSDELAEEGSEYVLKELINLLSISDNDEVKYLAARTLGLIENNESAYEELLAAINNKNNNSCSGGLTEALEGFDLSARFVDIFKLYLFGNLKTSGLAKRLLDYEEFDITPRVIRKSEKHWNHYKNNVKHDESFEVTKIEVEGFLDDLKSMFEE